jgi:hypothetical protein
VWQGTICPAKACDEGQKSEKQSKASQRTCNNTLLKVRHLENKQVDFGYPGTKDNVKKNKGRDQTSGGEARNLKWRGHKPTRLPNRRRQRKLRWFWLGSSADELGNQLVRRASDGKSLGRTPLDSYSRWRAQGNKVESCLTVSFKLRVVVRARRPPARHQ